MVYQRNDVQLIYTCVYVTLTTFLSLTPLSLSLTVMWLFLLNNIYFIQMSGSLHIHTCRILKDIPFNIIDTMKFTCCVCTLYMFDCTRANDNQKFQIICRRRRTKQYPNYGFCLVCVCVCQFARRTECRLNIAHQKLLLFQYSAYK